MKDKPMTSAPRRILFIQTQAENAGAQEISRMLGEDLTKRGHEVHHLFFYRKSETFNDLDNQTIVCEKRPANPLDFARFLGKLVKDIRSITPDIVFTFQHFGNTVGAPAARLAGVRRIVANQVSARELVNPVLRQVDHLFGTFGLYQNITVNSRDLESDYSTCSKAYRDRIILLPHGFEPKRSTRSPEEARKVFKLPSEVTMLGSIARLNETKQLDRAIKILPHRPDWHLAIAGQGPERSVLEALSEDFDIKERVHFVGELGPSEVGDFLKALNAFVFPSRAETFGLAAVEAADAGLPVICNDISVLREVLEVDGKPAAYFVDVDDQKAFAETVNSALQKNDETAAILEAASKLNTLYARTRMVDVYEELALSEKTVLSQPRSILA